MKSSDVSQLQQTEAFILILTNRVT